MYKRAGYQLSTDETIQAELEQAVAPLLLERYQQNLQAFRQYIPSINSLLQNHNSQQYSVLCNKFAELNIVDFAVGQMFYQSHPQQEVAEDVQQYYRSAPFIWLDNHQASNVAALPEQIELLVMFGLGAGYQLESLVAQRSIHYLIVYEPSTDILACSAQMCNWKSILQQAAAKGTAIFLQIGNDASSLPADLAELLQQVDVGQCYFYRHYSHPVMDKVFNYMLQHSGDRQALTNDRLHLGRYDNLYDEAESRHANTIASRQVSLSITTENPLYLRNMDALQIYYPQIYTVMQVYQPKHWQLVTDDTGKANLWQEERKALFYADIDIDSKQLIDDFCQHPFQDDVFIGHRPGYKLHTYLHNQQVTKLLPILERSVKKRNYLPEQIDSLIVFGIALGKHITQLMQQHKVQNLYICEPNLDFFAASLNITDWAEIFEQAKQNKQRIYLNLGGDGDQYFQDLMRQFYMVGAYSIANTYLLTSYYSEKMNKAILELRSNLKVVLAVGEYFDHARFGIAHTYGAFALGAKLLQLGCASRRYPALQLPIFIVGNGPSLDECFDYLHEYRDKAIIISCGTALKALHKQGIQPDFHAELEQNRATYDWVTQVNDPDYLKGIRLLSVNGIHPDTTELFAETLLCFKDGEASSHLFQPALKQAGIEAESLAYSYPTVTNMVLNMMLKMGFQSLYLFGVDLGFADINYHHSRHSAYFKADGQAVYDYQKAHGGGLPVAGNFLPFVFTKPEFDVSRKLLEQAIQDAQGKCEIYNCSNGVRIAGTVPLHPNNILLTTSPADKTVLLGHFIEQAYQNVPSALAKHITDKLDPTLLRQTMDDWQLLLAEDIESEQQAKQLIDEQWKLLLKSKLQLGNPAFILFNGSTNYFSAIMLKLAVSTDHDDNSQLSAFNEVLAVWREYLAKGGEQYLAEPLKYDEVSMQYLLRKHLQT